MHNVLERLLYNRVNLDCPQVSDAGIREANLTALKGVVKYAGMNVSSAVKTRVYMLLKDMIHHDDDQVRISGADILGIISQVCQKCSRPFYLLLFIFMSSMLCLVIFKTETNCELGHGVVGYSSYLVNHITGFQS